MKKMRFICSLTITILMFLICTNKIINADENTTVYDGELGYLYRSDSTIFRVLSHGARKVTIVVDDLENGTKDLVKEANGVWTGYIGSDLQGKEYSITIEDQEGNIYTDLLDPYGKYLNLAGTRNVIYDDSVAAVTGIDDATKHFQMADKNKIIYGINVNAFTTHQSWIGTEENRGKLLGLTESTLNTYLTGYNYVRSLGVTYIELSNIINENNPYSIDPKYIIGVNNYSGNIELKQVVKAYYDGNIGVILTFDYKALSSKFLQSVGKLDKDSYLNEQYQLDINKKATQKYIQDLLMYYVNEYKIAGFRLVNINEYSVEFMQSLITKLKEISTDIVVYGDGGYTSESTSLVRENTFKDIEGIKLINGSYNYAMFGNLADGSVKGILEGNYSKSILESLKFTLLSSVDNGDIDYSAVEGISYKNDWENTTSYSLINEMGKKNGISIYDKLTLNNITGENIIKQKLVLAFGTLMMSGGIPYINAGDEFLSSYLDTTNNQSSVCTDNGAFCFYTEDKYKIIDWGYAERNKNVVDSFKSLINYRKTGNSIAQTSTAFIKNNVDIYTDDRYDGVVGFEITYQNVSVRNTQKIFVVFNYSNNDYVIEGVGDKKWQGLYNYNASSRDSDKIMLKANSLYSEYKVKEPKVNSWITLILLLAVIGGLYYFNIAMNRKLVEEKGYDIKDINKKYRPFIRKDRIRNQINTTDEYYQEESETQTVVDENQQDEETVITEENNKDNNKD